MHTEACIHTHDTNAANAYIHKYIFAYILILCAAKFVPAIGANHNDMFASEVCIYVCMYVCMYMYRYALVNIYSKSKPKVFV
jgi:hypothetical protein